MSYIFSSPSQCLNEGTLLDLYFVMFHANMKFPFFRLSVRGFTFRFYGKKGNTVISVDGSNPEASQ